MEEKFKKALLGYNIEQVDKKILYINQELKKTYEEYEKELNTLRTQSSELENQISRLTDEVEIYNDFNDKLGNILCNTYIKCSEEVYNSKEILDKKINEKTSELVSLQNKNLDIRNSVNKLLSKLENIVNEL